MTFFRGAGISHDAAVVMTAGHHAVDNIHICKCAFRLALINSIHRSVTYHNAAPAVLAVAIKILHMGVLKGDIPNRQLRIIVQISDKSQIGVAVGSIALLIDGHIGNSMPLSVNDNGSAQADDGRPVFAGKVNIIHNINRVSVAAITVLTNVIRPLTKSGRVADLHRLCIHIIYKADLVAQLTAAHHISHNSLSTHQGRILYPHTA